MTRRPYSPCNDATEAHARDVLERCGKMERKRLAKLNSYSVAGNDRFTGVKSREFATWLRTQ